MATPPNSLCEQPGEVLGEFPAIGAPKSPVGLRGMPPPAKRRTATNASCQLVPRRNPEHAGEWCQGLPGEVTHQRPGEVLITQSWFLTHEDADLVRYDHAPVGDGEEQRLGACKVTLDFLPWQQVERPHVHERTDDAIGDRGTLSARSPRCRSQPRPQHHETQPTPTSG